MLHVLHAIVAKPLFVMRTEDNGIGVDPDIPIGSLGVDMLHARFDTPPSHCESWAAARRAPRHMSGPTVLAKQYRTTVERTGQHHKELDRLTDAGVNGLGRSTFVSAHTTFQPEPTTQCAVRCGSGTCLTLHHHTPQQRENQAKPSQSDDNGLFPQNKIR